MTSWKMASSMFLSKIPGGNEDCDMWATLASRVLGETKEPGRTRNPLLALVLLCVLG